MDFVRNLAVIAIKQIEEKEGYSNLVLNDVIKTYKKELSSQQIGFLSELVYGTVTWKLTIDTILEKYVTIKMKKLSKWVLAILRIGAYQILFLDKVPKSAAVNESVNLCKKYAFRSSGFVNAVLRKIQKEDREELNNIQNPIERISKMYSMPQWMVEEFVKEWGEKQTEEIAIASNQKADISFRINRLKTTKEEVIKELEQEGILVKEGLLSDFVKVEKIKDIGNLSLYKEGKITVQDEAAGLPSLLLEPKTRETILDCCSAPGGKTTYLAELMQNKGRIIAWDIYKNRLEKVRENANRLGITMIETYMQDASQFDAKQKEQYDAVLLDVPCLGLGVLKRKPDIKWQKKKEEIEEIQKIQQNILEVASQYVKKGGRLVYSTCSILTQENHSQVENFLAKHPEFAKIEIMNPEILKMIGKQKTKGEIQLFQNEKHDGFFICLMQKQK